MHTTYSPSIGCALEYIYMCIQMFMDGQQDFPASSHFHTCMCWPYVRVRNYWRNAARNHYQCCAIANAHTRFAEQPLGVCHIPPNTAQLHCAIPQHCKGIQTIRTIPQSEASIRMHASPSLNSTTRCVDTGRMPTGACLAACAPQFRQLTHHTCCILESNLMQAMHDCQDTPMLPQGHCRTQARATPRAAQICT
jgi:hypothetical protein